MTDSGWEHFHHGADIGVRGYGADLESAFSQAALAMTAVITEPASINAKERVSIAVEAPDDDLLLMDWLNAIIYEMSTRKMLFRDFEVKIEGHRLSATIAGEAVDVKKHQPVVEIKGATLTALEVRRNEQGGWVAQCVVDV